MDVNVVDFFGYTVLHLYCNRTEVVDFLLKQPAIDVNIIRKRFLKTPLHYATMYLPYDQEVPYVLKLLKAGARTDIKDGAGQLPLHGDFALQDVARKVQVLLVLCRLKGVTERLDSLFKKLFVT